MSELQKQLIDTYAEMDDELHKSNPDDTRLEFFVRKIAVLEEYAA